MGDGKAVAQLQPGGTEQAELGFVQHSQRSTPKNHSGKQKEDRDPPSPHLHLRDGQQHLEARLQDAGAGRLGDGDALPQPQDLVPHARHLQHSQGLSPPAEPPQLPAHTGGLWGQPVGPSPSELGEEGARRHRFQQHGGRFLRTPLPEMPPFLGGAPS